MRWPLRQSRRVKFAATALATGALLVTAGVFVWWQRESCELRTRGVGQEKAAANLHPEGPLEECLRHPAVALAETREVVATEGTASVPAPTPSPGERQPAATELVLTVLDAVTNNQLANVDVVCAIKSAGGEMHHPGTGTGRVFVARQTRSPVRIQVPETVTGIWVGSPGYAWSPSGMESDPFLVRLAPGGSIVVNVTGGTVPAAAVFRVWPAEVRPPGTSDADWRERHCQGMSTVLQLAEFVPGPTTTHFDGLPVGRWSIALELGHVFAKPLQLGEIEVDVCAGTIGQATLVLDERAIPPPTVRAAGTLFLPKDWGEAVSYFCLQPTGVAQAWSREGVSFDLDFEPVPLAEILKPPILMTAEPTATVRRNAAGEFCWDAGRLLAGTYHVSVGSSGYLTSIHVGPNDEISHRIVVPPPCDVVVRFVDADSGALLRFDGAAGNGPQWVWCSPEGGGLYRDMKAQVDGALTFQAPPGRIDVIAAPGYSLTAADFVVRLGKNEFTIASRRECGVEVMFKEGDGEPYPAWDCDLLNPDGSSAAYVRYSSDGRTTAQAPGTFTLTVNVLDRYEPVAPQQVTVSAAAWTRIEIPLIPKR